MEAGTSGAIQGRLLQILEAVGARDGLVYLCVPITSGLRELGLMSELGVSSRELRTDRRELWQQKVLAENVREAHRLSNAVRSRRIGRLVIDPSFLEIPEWTQEDYRLFWIDLIGRFASALVACPDWEFSQGARGEVGYALSRSIPVLDFEDQSIDWQAARELDERARAQIIEMGISPDELNLYLPPISPPESAGVAESSG
jgi:hypothetical protein